MTEDELRAAKDVLTGKIKRKDSLVSDEKFDTILTSLNKLAIEIEKDFVDNCVTDFAKDRLQPDEYKNVGAVTKSY